MEFKVGDIVKSREAVRESQVGSLYYVLEIRHSVRGLVDLKVINITFPQYATEHYRMTCNVSRVNVEELTEDEVLRVVRYKLSN